MSSVKASSILAASAVLAALAVGALGYPLAAHRWKEMSEARDFTSANESTQTAIVRSYLQHELRHTPMTSPTGTHALEPIFFDRRSAVLRPLDAPEPWDEYEVRSADRKGELVNPADTSIPVRLQELLDRTTLSQGYNSDPNTPGVTYVATPRSLPLLGARETCNDTLRPRLIRISKAVVYEPGDLAIALIATTFCDRSTGMRVVSFTRDGAKWRVLEDRRDGRR
jgi:hypothetical protein